MRTKTAKCGRCFQKSVRFKGTYSITGKPEFECSSCFHLFTCGESGGEYAYLISEMGEK